MNDAFVEGLATLPPEIVLTDPDLLSGYVRDESRLTESGSPLAVLVPRTTDEVVACVRVCAAAGVSLVTRGAGSGLSGGANAVDGAVVLSMHRMSRILDIDPVERLAVVQPGVVTGDVRRAAAAAGLHYPLRPGERRLLHDRGQRRHQRRRHVLREVRGDG